MKCNRKPKSSEPVRQVSGWLSREPMHPSTLFKKVPWKIYVAYTATHAKLIAANRIPILRVHKSGLLKETRQRGRWVNPESFSVWQVCRDIHTFAIVSKSIVSPTRYLTVLTAIVVAEVDDLHVHAGIWKRSRPDLAVDSSSVWSSLECVCDLWYKPNWHCTGILHLILKASESQSAGFSCVKSDFTLTDLL